MICASLLTEGGYAKVVKYGKTGADDGKALPGASRKASASRLSDGLAPGSSDCPRLAEGWF